MPEEAFKTAFSFLMLSSDGRLFRWWFTRQKANRSSLRGSPEWNCPRRTMTDPRPRRTAKLAASLVEFGNATSPLREPHDCRSACSPRMARHNQWIVRHSQSEACLTSALSISRSLAVLLSWTDELNQEQIRSTLHFSLSDVAVSYGQFNAEQRGVLHQRLKTPHSLGRRYASLLSIEAPVLLDSA